MNSPSAVNTFIFTWLDIVSVDFIWSSSESSFSVVVNLVVIPFIIWYTPSISSTTPSKQPEVNTKPTWPILNGNNGDWSLTTNGLVWLLIKLLIRLLLMMV